MATKDQVFYSSENGDDWLLVVDSQAAPAVVRHRPNASSGGQSRDFALKDFLAREQNTPQGQALRRIIDADLAEAGSPS